MALTCQAGRSSLTLPYEWLFLMARLAGLMAE